MKIEKKQTNAINLIPILTALSMLFLCADLFAAPPGDFSVITTHVKTATSEVRTIVNYILGAACLIGLITVVYKVVTKAADSKEYVIGLILAIIVWIIAMKLIP